MPAVNDVGEPCAGEPHNRFDGRELETERLVRVTEVGQPDGKPRAPRLLDLTPQPSHRANSRPYTVQRLVLLGEPDPAVELGMRSWARSSQPFAGAAQVLSRPTQDVVHTPKGRIPMTNLVLARHGETIWHAENRYAGASDVALSRRGMQQAAQLAAWANTAHLDAVWASDLSRSQVTARVSADASGTPLHID